MLGTTLTSMKWRKGGVYLCFLRFKIHSNKFLLHSSVLEITSVVLYSTVTRDWKLVSEGYKRPRRRPGMLRELSGARWDRNLASSS